MKGYDATFLLLVMKGEKKCLPIGFQTGFHLNSFRKGETLNKQYIINKIANNPKFMDYIPNGVDPMSLTRDFLLTVRIYYLNFFKLVAFLEPELYKQFYTISKTQAGNSTLNRWEDYNLIVEKKIYEKIKQFVPINNFGSNKNNKGFRTTKNGIDTGLFTKINNPLILNNNNMPNNINSESDTDNNIINRMQGSNLNINRIKIIPKNKIEIDEQ